MRRRQNIPNQFENGQPFGPLVKVSIVLFFQASIGGEAKKLNAEIMADTAVALASSNVKLVSKKIISRLCKVGLHVTYTCTVTIRMSCSILCYVVLYTKTRASIKSRANIPKNYAIIHAILNRKSR